MAVVNPVMSPTTVIYPATAAVKDSRWLTLDVCREYTRNKCSRSDDECRFAHPPPNVEVQNGRVMCCFDSIKGKCQRRDPPCKYLHPPQHLKEQLLQNGRNNLILKHLQMQMIAHAIPGVYPIMYDMNSGKSYSTSYAAIPAGQESYMAPQFVVQNAAPGYAPFYAPSPYAATPVYHTAIGPTGAPIPISMATTMDSNGQQQILLVGNSPAGSPGGQQNNPSQSENGTGGVAPSTTTYLPCTTTGVPTTAMCGPCSSPTAWQPSPSSPTTTDSAAGPPGATTYCSPVYFPAATNGIPGIVPVIKRGTDGKCGLPVYQPAAFAYQQMAIAAMQLQPPAYVPIPIAGQPPIDQRY